MISQNILCDVKKSTFWYQKTLLFIDITNYIFYITYMIFDITYPIFDITKS